MANRSSFNVGSQRIPGRNNAENRTEEKDEDNQCIPIERKLIVIRKEKDEMCETIETIETKIQRDKTITKKARNKKKRNEKEKKKINVLIRKREKSEKKEQSKADKMLVILKNASSTMGKNIKYLILKSYLQIRYEKVLANHNENVLFRDQKRFVKITNLESFVTFARYHDQMLFEQDNYNSLCYHNRPSKMDQTIAKIGDSINRFSLKRRSKKTKKFQQICDSIAMKIVARKNNF